MKYSWVIILVWILFAVEIGGKNTGLSRHANPSRNEITATANGLLLSNPAYNVSFTDSGIDMTPTSGAPSWTLTYPGEEKIKPELHNDKIVYDRGTFSEEYIIKHHSIEQQFIVNEAPKVIHDIVLEGKIESDGAFTKTKDKWTWGNGIGQVTLSNVFAFDAGNRPVPAMMEVSEESSRITILASDLETVQYPLTIDPEIGTNDFRISQFGVDTDLTYLANDPAVAYSSTTDRYLVVWEGSISGEVEIYGQLWNASTNVAIGGAFKISDMGPSGNAAFDAFDADVASSGSEFFVVWYGDDVTDNEYEIYGRRIQASSGALLGSDEIRISDMGTDGSSLYGAFSPAVVYNSTQSEYMVVWNGDDNSGALIDEEFEVYSQRITSAGVETGTNDVRISDMGVDGSTQYSVGVADVAWNSINNQYLVTWYGDDSASPLVDDEFEIFIQRLDGTTGGQTGTNDVRISDMGPNGNLSYTALTPSVAYNSVNNNYLVVWQGDDDQDGVIDNETEIYGQLLTNLGAESGVDFRISDMGPNSNANYDAANATVQFDSFNGKFLVLWQGDDNTGGLVDNEIEIFGQWITGGGAEIWTNDFRLSDVGGIGNATYNAARPALAYNPAKYEFLTTWDADDNVGGPVDGEFEIYGQRFADKKSEPVAQPTSPVSGSITPSSFSISFSAAAADGYIVLRRSGSAPAAADTLKDQTTYSVNDVVGSSTVAYVGSTAGFSQSSLSPATNYFFHIFDYNGTESAINYRAASPLLVSVTTLSTEPTVQPTSLSVSNPTTTSLDISFTAASGSPTGYLVLRKAGSVPTDVPVDGGGYTAGNTIGSSTVVSVGSTTSFTDTGLSSNVVYHYAVFAYNGSGASLNYLTAAPLTNSRTTLTTAPSAQPTVPVFSSLTSSSFTLSYTAAAGSPAGYIIIRKTGSAPANPADLPIDGTAYTAGNSIGGSTVVYSGSSVSVGESGLSAATEYYYLIMSFNGSGANINYLTTSPPGANKFTLATDPSAQPTSPVFSSLTTTSMNLAWTAASGSPSGYIVLRRSGTAVTDVPTDATTYSAGNSVGSSNVAFVGSATSFSDAGLSSNTSYHYAIFSYTGSSSTINYLTASPLAANHSTLQTEPLNQPTVLTFNSVTSSSMNGSFTAAAGAPSGYIVLRKAGSSPTDIPVDGTTYGAGATIGASTVVASGGSTTFTSTSLSSGVTYFYDVISFNGSGDATNYLTTSPLEGSQVTTLNEPGSQPTNLVFSSITTSTATVSFSAAVGSPAGYLVLRKSGSSPTETPTDGVEYTVGNALGTSTIVFAGSATSFSSTGMSAATAYFYDVFSFNGSTGTYNYLPTLPLQGSHSTLSIEPTAQPTSAAFIGHTTTSYTLNFTAASGSPTGYLVLRRSGAAPTGNPVDGTAYTVGNSIGDGSVVAVGSGVSVAESGLSNGTNYQYRIFSFNGSAATLNYLTASPLTGSTATLCAAPVFNATSSVTQTSLTLSWPAVTGATSYKLEISSDDFVSFFASYSPKTIAIGTDPISESVSGLSPGVNYKFKVRAVNSTGESANGTSQMITRPATPVIGTIQSSTLTQTAFTLPWTAVTGADKYLVDISINENFSSFLTGYEAKEVTGTSLSVTGLSAGTVYFSRIRSSNSSGASPNSAIVSQETKPATPVFASVKAEDISTSSFKVDWDDAKGATSYEIEVSKDEFAHLVDGYNPKVISDASEIVVNGLESKTLYKFRLRSNSAAGYSPYSASGSAETKESDGVSQFRINTASSNTVLRTGFGTSTLTVNVTGGVSPRAVRIKHRGIAVAGDVWIEDTATPTTGDNFTFTVTEAMLDDFGMEYYFTATDDKGAIATPQAAHSFIYRGLNTNAIPEIPNLSAGGQIENYRIISIPYQLEDNLVQAIFGVLGDYDPASWRLIHYQNGKNVDYPGFNRILPGLGYWFNSVDAISIKSGDGNVLQVNQSNPFTLNLAKGWNQIGNPYTFDVNWSAVQSNNFGKAVGKLYTFNPASGLLEESSGTLKVWSGGFVFADTDINGLSFPVTLKNSSRVSSGNVIQSQVLDAPEWKVKLSLKQGSSENNHIAFGMHPDALQGKDIFDEVEVPRFFHYLEMNTTHPEFFAPRFSNDIVPTQEKYEWEFNVTSDLDSKQSTLSWDPNSFGNNTAQLWLYDQAAEMLIDMRSTDHYAFEITGNRMFTISYSANEHDWNPGINLLGRPWPNPSAGQTNIPVVLANDSDVVLDVMDMNGKKIRTVINERLSSGMHTFEWSGDKDDGQPASPGLYLVRIGTGSGYVQTRKLIIH